MSLLVAALLVAVGLALVLAFAGRLVRGVVGTSAGFGISAFLISVVFVGFDPENLAVGAAGAWEDVAGIALGPLVEEGGEAIPCIGVGTVRFHRCALACHGSSTGFLCCRGPLVLM